jgi:hypothetical protein
VNEGQSLTPRLARRDAGRPRRLRDWTPLSTPGRAAASGPASDPAASRRRRRDAPTGPGRAVMVRVCQVESDGPVGGRRPHSGSHLASRALRNGQRPCRRAVQQVCQGGRDARTVCTAAARGQSRSGPGPPVHPSQRVPVHGPGPRVPRAPASRPRCPPPSPCEALSFASNRQRRREVTFCASELAGIEPTPPATEEQGMPAFAN